MKKRRIVSPMASGNGAYILHKMIEKHIPNYTVKGYNPYLTIFPFSLPCAARVKGADLIHTVPGLRQIFLSRIDSIGSHIPQLCAGSLDEALLFLGSKTPLYNNIKVFVADGCEESERLDGS